MEFFFGFRSMDCQADQHIFISIFLAYSPFAHALSIRISLMQPIEVWVVFISFIQKQLTCMCIRFQVSSVEFVYIVYVLQSIQINVFLRLILFECLFVGHINHEKKNYKRTERKKNTQKRTTKMQKKEKLNQKTLATNPSGIILRMENIIQRIWICSNNMMVVCIVNIDSNFVFGVFGIVLSA